MSNLPSSWDHKQRERGKYLFPRWVYVHELKNILEKLEPTDWVTTGDSGDFVVCRGDDYYATLDLYTLQLNVFDGDTNGK